MGSRPPRRPTSAPERRRSAGETHKASQRLAQVPAKPPTPVSWDHDADQPAARARGDALEVNRHVTTAVGPVAHVIVDQRARPKVRRLEQRERNPAGL